MESKFLPLLKITYVCIAILNKFTTQVLILCKRGNVSQSTLKEEQWNVVFSCYYHDKTNAPWNVKITLCLQRPVLIIAPMKLWSQSTLGGILACGERSQAAQLLTHCLITRPHQEKPPNPNWEQSIWFTTEHILMFKYRQEQRPKMTRSILSQQRLKTTPLLLSSEFCVVWHCGPSVNKMWSNGSRLSPANPCLPDYMMRA